jgi:predicted dienelactone hydrolase
MKRIVLFGLIALLMMPLIVHAQRPDAPRYGQRGPYPVGTQDLVIDDGQGPPLNATLWYPALNPEGREETDSYQVGMFMLPGRALRDAVPDLAHGPYPLVLFSHGNSGYRFQSVFFTEHLASHGFVVLAADHPGNTGIDQITNPAEFPANLIRSFGTRPLEELRQIAYMDRATVEGGDLAGLVDMERMAVSGHSFGGYTALSVAGARLDFAAMADWCSRPLDVDPRLPVPVPDYTGREQIAIQRGACFVSESVARIAEARGLSAPPEGLWPATTDPRLDAVVAMAPWNTPAFGADGLAALNVPALVLVGSADDVTIPVRDGYAAYRDIASARKTLVVFENAGHYVFADGCSDLLLRFGLFDSCSDPVWDMDRVHDLTNHFTTAFLLAHLYDDTGAAAALNDDAMDFTGVTALQN